jgi:hypothetical protein
MGEKRCAATEKEVNDLETRFEESISIDDTVEEESGPPQRALSKDRILNTAFFCSINSEC